jgi:sugar phosphate isomerase/epimerase
MKIGVRAHDFPKQSPECLAKEIRAAGFNAVQLALYKALDIREEEMMKPDTLFRIRDAFHSAGLEISVLGCYVDPGAEQSSVRQSSADRFREHIHIAKKLGAACVATETTAFSGTVAKRESAYGRILAFVREMAKEAEDAGTFIAIEPVLAHTIHTPEMAARLLHDVDCGRLRIIFDPINLLSPIDAEKQDDLWQRCMDCFGDKVIAMHVKDGFWQGSRYIPQPLGQGAMHFDPLFKWIREKKPDLPLLREEAMLSYVDADIAFLKAAFVSAL